MEIILNTEKQRSINFFSRWFLFLFLVAFSFVLLASFPLSVNAAANTTVKTPAIEIPIPHITFSSGLVEPGTGELIAPWIGEYASGVYQFLLSIVGILAGVYILIGGYTYLTAGGSADRAENGKKRIINALTGLILAFGSYVILFTINPDLVTFEALRIKVVKTDPWDVLESSLLGTTKADTSITEETSTPPAPGEYVFNYYPKCPFEYKSPVYGKDSATASKKEFLEKSAPFLTEKDIRNRIQQAAQMVGTCRPNLGSCGTTIGTIWAMAFNGNSQYTKMSLKSSAKNTSCLDPNLPKGKRADSKFNCNGFSLKTRLTLPSSMGAKKFGRRCILDRFKSRYRQNVTAKAKLARGGTMTKNDLNYLSDTWRDKKGCNMIDCKGGKDYPWHTGPNVPGCFKTSSGARFQFLKELSAAGESGKHKSLVGYPDSWAETLRPGDYINIYNGNQDLTGGHAIMFLGWAKDGKNAYTIEGGGGNRKGYGAGAVKAFGTAGFGKRCLKKACGDKIMPMTKIFSFQ